MNLARWHRRLVESGPVGPVDYLAYIVFFPLALLYGLVARIRGSLYESGFLPSYGSTVPVIAIGNLAAGGTGKTPVTDLLLRNLLARGFRVAVVSRGYGRISSEPLTVVCSGEGPLVSATEGGDEPVMLATRNPAAIVIVCAERRKGVEKAVADYGAEIILLDDGFQHLKVRRDLDILLLDERRPFGNGLPLPFGILREFPSASERADVVVLTRSTGEGAFRVGDKPIVHLAYKLSDHAISGRGDKFSLKSLSPGRIGAFAGIAVPESFFNSLQDVGIETVETLSFSDHVVYGTAEMADLHALASRCDVMLTTEKDLVKLKAENFPCDCLAVPLELDLSTGDDLISHVETALVSAKEKMMLKEDLLDILACPKCKGEVRYDKDAQQVICDACQLAYPVRDGIPMMLVDEASTLD